MKRNFRRTITILFLDAHKAQHAAFVKAVGELNEMLEEEEGPSEAFVAAVKKKCGRLAAESHLCVG